MALGMIEVYGLVAAFAACDAGCKAANVTVEPFDKNKPANPEGLPVPLQVLVKFRGSVEDVKAAVEALADAKPAKLFLARTMTKNLNFVRHYIMEDGTYDELIADANGLYDLLYGQTFTAEQIGITE